MEKRSSLLEKRVLQEPEAYRILAAEGLPLPVYGVGESLEEAISIAEEIGYPVALKVVSSTILHKSDMGGVQLHLRSEDQVREAYQQIERGLAERAPSDPLEGVLVSEMVEPGLEVVVGMVKDPTFGPAIMFGLGGLFLEVMEDVSFRVAPLDEELAFTMIREIKGYPLLKGYRGQEAMDEEALADILMRVSKLSLADPNLQEIDLNPVILRADGATIVDALIMKN